jgi:MFS family permease
LSRTIPIDPAPRSGFSREESARAVRLLLAFQCFNAMMFTIALGAPMVLLARFLGATEGVIGILNAIPTGLVIMQLVGAGLVERQGTRRIMVLGWFSRTIFILPIIAAPLLAGRLPGDWLIVLGLGLPLLAFSFLRGIATTAWLPWLNELLPATRRGRFFGTEQMVINISAFGTLLLCGWFLGEDPEAWRYSVLFLACFFAGMMSVFFLRKVPGGHPDPAMSGQPRQRAGDRWRQVRRLLNYGPWFRTWRFIVVQVFAISPVPMFLVLFLRDQLQLPEGIVLKMQAMMTLGVLLSAVAWGRLSDSAGSRPMLRIAGVSLIAVISFWLFAACGLFRPPVALVVIAFLVYGMFQSMHGIAQARMTIGCCPQRMITIATAIIGVSVSLAAATASIGWGFVLEHLGGANPGGPVLGYAVMFLTCAGLSLAAQTMLTRVPEPRAMSARRVLQVLYGWPVRVLASLAAGNRGEDAG